MKKINQDSASALSRFSRDKRTRTSAAESAEHTPRPRREADNEGRQGRGRQSAEGRGRQTSQGRPASNGRRTNETRRASFNPNFTSDNRPAFREEGSFSEEKPRYGARTERGQRGTSTRSNGGSKPFGSKERKFGSTEKTFGAKSGFKSDSRGRGKRGSNEERTHSYPKYSSKQFGAVRLNKFLAQSGLCSRREADDFITAGLVTVNGVIVTELGTKVMPSDEVKFNDSKVQGEKKVSAAQLVYDGAERKFENGLISALDLQTAANTLLQAQSDKLRARLQYIIKTRMVDYYNGMPLIR